MRGRARECRHNLIYWRYRDYVGIGPGAHGRVTLGGDKLATRRHRAPETWLAAVERARTRRCEERIALAPAERREEMLMMGLRLDRRDRRARGSAPRPAPISKRRSMASASPISSPAVSSAMDARGLRATAAGRQRLNAVLAALMV